MKKDKKISEEKKNRKLVKEAFRYVDENGKKTKESRISKNMIHAIAESVRVNQALIKRDKKALKAWQDDYYQELFSDFKKLIDKHNEIYQIKADDLINMVNSRKRELKTLKAEVKKLEAEKELLAKND
jgi:hypothetical protein